MTQAKESDELIDALSEGLSSTVCNGHPEASERSYRLIFSFPTMDAMHRAQDAYVKATLSRPTQPASGAEVREAAETLLATVSLLTFSRKTAATRALPQHMADLRKALRALPIPEAGAGVREALRVQTDLVGRLCDAVDREAEDIGGESSLSVLRLLGPHHAVAVAALTKAVRSHD